MIAAGSRVAIFSSCLIYSSPTSQCVSFFFLFAALRCSLRRLFSSFLLSCLGFFSRFFMVGGEVGSGVTGSSKVGKRA